MQKILFSMDLSKLSYEKKASYIGLDNVCMYAAYTCVFLHRVGQPTTYTETKLKLYPN